MGLDSVGIHENYFELGGDSLLSIRILARARKAGFKMSPEAFFAEPTIAQQAALAEGSGPASAKGAVATGPAPLTPIQHWFFERITNDPQQWNESFLLEVNERVDCARLEKALNEILRRHDSLRLRFERRSEGNDVEWIQAIDAPAGAQLPRIDIASLSAQEQEEAIERTAAEMNRGFDLAKGGLMSFALFETAVGLPDRLLIVAHHLLVDAISWQVLLEDLETACGQAVAGQPFALPAKTSSFKQWAETQAGRATAQELGPDIAYWKQRLPDDDARLPLDIDNDPGLNTLAGAESLTFELDPDTTRSVLQDLPRKFRTQINDPLLSALARTVTAWTGRPSAIVDLEGHGRDVGFDGLDLTRTVGWLTTVFPLRLNVAQDDDPVASLQSVKEQLRALPTRGAGFGRLAYLASDLPLSERLRSAPKAQLCFNYLGQTDLMQGDGALLRVVRERCGPLRSPAGPRAYLLEINARVAQGRLVVDWTYHKDFHRAETIDRLGNQLLTELRQLIARAEDKASQTEVPSDFPLAGLDEGDLARLSQLLGGTDRAKG